VKTITLRGTEDRTFDVPAEPTAVVDLYLAPNVNFDGPTYSGVWLLVHASSGRAFPIQRSDPDELRDLASELAKVAPDWTGLDEDPKKWPADTRDAVVATAKAWRERADELDAMWAGA
jgi:hypothetical protein